MNPERAPRENKTRIVMRMARKQVVGDAQMRVALVALGEAQEMIETAALLKGDNGELRDERLLGGIHAVLAQHVISIKAMLRGQQ